MTSVRHSEAAVSLLERNPRLFWGRVVQAFLKAGWNPPRPDEKVIASMTDAIRDIERGSFRPAEEATLSARQSQILAGAASGLSVSDMSERFHLAEGTIKFHLLDARRKLGARTTTHAVALAMEQDLLVLDV